MSGLSSFRVVEFWGCQVLGLSSFGVVEFRGRRVSGLSSFGVEFRGCRVLEL